MLHLRQLVEPVEVVAQQLAFLRSSSPGAAERAYQEDVSDYTRAYAKSGGGDYRAFQTDLARLAEEHGITVGQP